MKKKYWLRGGILLLIIGIVINFVELFVLNTGTCLNLSTLGGDDTYGTGLPIWCHILSPGAYLPIPFIGLIIFLVVWFFYGTILGWIYGKIKNKNQNLVS